jgi:hypothetical protein
MRKSGLVLLTALLFGTAGAAQAQIYSNGPLVTHLDGGALGFDASRVQNLSLGLTVLGYTASGIFSLADDFTFGAAMDITSFRFFAYQTNSGMGSTITDLFFQVWAGAPSVPGSAVIFGDMVTNRLTGTGFTGIFRDSETGPGSDARPIMFADAAVALSLGPGTYWVQWAMAGSLAASVFVPPVTILGQVETGDGMQYNAGTGIWSDAIDTGAGRPQGLPFEIYGAPARVVPEPLTVLLVATGLTGMAALRRRRRQS